MEKYNTAGGESLPTSLADEALKTFARVSGQYPASGTVQAASIAMRSYELSVTPDTMLEGLRAWPEGMQKLVEMANTAHDHSNNHQVPTVTEDTVQTVLWRVFSVAQEMTEQWPPEEIARIITDEYPRIKDGGVAAESAFTAEVKRRLGIAPGIHSWRRNTYAPRG